MKGCTTPLGSTPPTLYEQQCGFFYVPQESEQWKRKSCKTAEPTEFCPFPRRPECLTICRCYNKGSKFSSVILRPWVLVQPGFEPTPSRSADRQTKSRKRERRASKSNGYVKQWVALELQTKDVSTLEPCAHLSARVHCLDLVIGRLHLVQSLSRVLKKGCVCIRIKCSWAPCPVLAPKCSYFMHLFSDLPDKLLNYRILF